jgi:GntR family transcriptional regulator
MGPGSPWPLYAQLESILAAEIASGTFPSGSQLPNEAELVERYGVSRTTIRQTIQNLVRRGLIEIRRGKGTFVLHPKIMQELTELSGFVEVMRSLGRQASARLLDKQTVPASESRRSCPRDFGGNSGSTHSTRAISGQLAVVLR